MTSTRQKFFSLSRGMTIISLFLVFYGSPLQTQGAGQARPVSNWPTFRFNTAHTGYNPAETILRPPLELKWSSKIGESVDSSPAVANGVVYVGSLWWVYALDAAGNPIWSYKTHDFVNSSPAVVKGLIYIGSDRVYALDSASGKLIWSYKSIGKVNSSPTVANGVVYVGSDKVYALNSASGKLIWSYKTAGYVSSSPAVVNGVVYVGSRDGKVNALDAGSGRLIWSYKIGDSCGSLAIANGVVYVGSDKVYALNSASGKLIWSYKTAGFVSSSPAVVNGVVYAISANKVYALDTASGKLKWSDEIGMSLLSSPAVANGILYVVSRYDNIYALDAASGKLIWRDHIGEVLRPGDKPAGLQDPVIANSVVYVGSGDGKVYAFGQKSTETQLVKEKPKQTQGAGQARPVSNWPTFRFNTAHTGYNPSESALKPPLELKWYYKTGEVNSSPAVANGVVYVGSSDRKIYALDAASGALIWRYRTGKYGAVDSSPSVANGVVYVGSCDKKVYALDAASGELIWRYRTGGHVWSSPAVANGVVYVGSADDKIYALDAASGNVIWSYKTGSDVWSSPAVANGVVYVGSCDKKIYALDAASGNVIWSYETGEWVNASPSVANGVVYVGSDKVYALDATSGKLIWSYEHITSERRKAYPFGSPAVANGLIYVGSDKVYALNSTSGKLIWTYKSDRAVLSEYSDPSVANGVVYVGSSDNKVYALDAASGKLIWSYKTGDRISSSPSVVNGVVYVGSDDGKVYAFVPTAAPPSQPKLGPVSVTMKLEPQRVQVNTGQRPDIKVRITNDGHRKITGLKLDVSLLGNIKLKKSSLQGGESLSQVVKLPPAERGLSEYEVRVTCSEGAYSVKRFFVNGVGLQKEPLPLPKESKRPRKRYSELIQEYWKDAARVRKERERVPIFEDAWGAIPYEIIGLKKLDSDKDDWGRCSTSFAAGTYRKLTNEEVIRGMKLRYIVRDKIIVTILEDTKRVKPLFPDDWKKKAAAKAKEYNGKLIYLDDFPIVYKPPFRKEKPTANGMFDLDYYDVDILGTGKYANEEDIKKASLEVLKHFLTALEDSFPQLELSVSPNLVEVETTCTIPFEVVVKNTGGSDVETVSLTFFDGESEILSAGFGKIPAHGEKRMDVSPKIEITGDKGTRQIIVAAASKGVDTATAKVMVRGRRPPVVSIAVEPEEVIYNPEDVSEYRIIWQNKGDLPAEIAIQAALVGTDYITEERYEDLMGGEIEVNTGDGWEIAWLIEQYMKDNKDLPPPGEIRYVLREEGGPIVDEASIRFRYGDKFKSKLTMQIDKKEAFFDLTPKPPEDELAWEEWEDSEEVDVGSPFGISLKNEGTLMAKNVRLEFLDRENRVVAYCEVPRVYTVEDIIDRGFEKEDIAKFPTDEKFVSLVPAKEGRNKFTVVLLEGGKEIARDTVYLNVKGLDWAQGKVYVGKKLQFLSERTVKVDSRIFDLYETLLKDKVCLIVTDQDGTIEKGKYLRRAGYADMLCRRLASEKALRLNRQQQKNVEDFLRWEGQARVALFFRDAASRALVDVGIIYMTGDTSQLTKQVAKEIAKDALKNAVMDIIKNPDNYLRAIAVKMLADSLYELRGAERKAQGLKGRIVSYDELVELEDVTTRAYSNIVPSFKLIKELSPKADILSQIQDVFNTMKSEFLNIFPGGEGYIKPEEAKNMYQRLGGMINEIYKRYGPYVEYQRQKQEVERHITQDIESAKKLANEKLENGLELTEGYIRFSRK